MTLLTTPTSMPPVIRRRSCLALAVAWSLSAQLAHAQGRQTLRISTPAVPEDWHARMWTVMKDQLEQTAPGQFRLRPYPVPHT